MTKVNDPSRGGGAALVVGTALAGGGGFTLALAGAGLALAVTGGVGLLVLLGTGTVGGGGVVSASSLTRSTSGSLIRVLMRACACLMASLLPANVFNLGLMIVTG